jgi:hypothetical protein
MQIQALNIRIGDRIVAYCNNNRQVCTVKQIRRSIGASTPLMIAPLAAKTATNIISNTRLAAKLDQTARFKTR